MDDSTMVRLSLIVCVLCIGGLLYLWHELLVVRSSLRDLIQVVQTACAPAVQAESHIRTPRTQRITQPLELVDLPASEQAVGTKMRIPEECPGGGKRAPTDPTLRVSIVDEAGSTPPATSPVEIPPPSREEQAKAMASVMRRDGHWRSKY